MQLTCPSLYRRILNMAVVGNKRVKKMRIHELMSALRFHLKGKSKKIFIQSFNINLQLLYLALEPF